jgi:hypothetical protein
MANNLDAFIPEVWSRSIIRNIDQLNVAMSLCANTDYEGEIRQAGDTVWVRTYGNVTIQDYQRGLSISYEDLTPVKESMTVNTSKYFAFSVDDLDRAQNDINATDGYTRRAAVAMSNHIDTFIFSKHTSANSANELTSSSSPYDISSETSGTAVYELVVAAGLALDKLNVAPDGRWIIIQPYAKSLLLKDTKYFINATDLGDATITSGTRTAREAMARGFIGQLANFDVYVSNNLPASGANTYWVYGQGKPISYAAQIPAGTLEALRLESTFSTAVRGLLLHDATVFTEDAKRLGSILVDNS